MADLDRGTVLEANFGFSELSAAQTNQPKLQTGRLEWPIMMIPLNTIVSESSTQTRQDVFDPDRYPEDAELQASIRQHGVIEPILVCRITNPGEEPQYQLIAGDRRRHAAAHTGLEMIPAIIRHYGEEITLLTLAENTGRRDLTSYERAIALAKILEINEEDLSFRQLAKKTGISLSSVSNLLKAYRDSPPALRMLFAEGMESRAVVVLQSIFTKFDESKQVDIAAKLRGLSKRQVLAIKDLIDQSISFDKALETILGSQIPTVNSENKPRNSIPKMDLTETSPFDESQIKAIADLTGASQKAIKSVISKAEKDRSGMDAIFLACAYLGRGGAPRDALANANVLAQNAKASKLVRRYLVLQNKAKKLIDRLDDGCQQEYLQTIFFGG